MRDVIERIQGSPDFTMVWRIPFETENSIAMQYVYSHVKDILRADCWAVGTTHTTFFNFYSIDVESGEYQTQREYRDNVLYHHVSCLFDSLEKVYIILGGQPFRYLTIEYNESGLGILTDFQIV